MIYRQAVREEPRAGEQAFDRDPGTVGLRRCQRTLLCARRSKRIGGLFCVGYSLQSESRTERSTPRDRHPRASQ